MQKGWNKFDSNQRHEGCITFIFKYERFERMENWANDYYDIHIVLLFYFNVIFNLNDACILAISVLWFDGFVWTWAILCELFRFIRSFSCHFFFISLAIFFYNALWLLSWFVFRRDSSRVPIFRQRFIIRNSFALIFPRLFACLFLISGALKRAKKKNP